MNRELMVAGECCPECGLRWLPTETSWPEIRDLLVARDFEQPARYWRYHRLAVDAYCLQHSAYVKSAKSLAAHLCGVCIAFEHGNDQAARSRSGGDRCGARTAIFRLSGATG